MMGLPPRRSKCCFVLFCNLCARSLEVKWPLPRKAETRVWIIPRRLGDAPPSPYFCPAIFNSPPALSAMSAPAANPPWCNPRGRAPPFTPIHLRSFPAVGLGVGSWVGESEGEGRVLKLLRTVVVFLSFTRTLVDLLTDEVVWIYLRRLSKPLGNLFWPRRRARRWRRWRRREQRDKTRQTFSRYLRWLIHGKGIHFLLQLQLEPLSPLNVDILGRGA
ncbi:hypothetical protein QBC41DRAFT_310390 [Cercophora samala]|uniref:Uncharacterized protein n=1 Tax=Cercophora samala TaxID=330535 RepID=A0AA39ZMW4_9PEZI|nr:hypothetical protein QBC41DRAFT_310390 [Cercophora samala]